MIQRYYEPPKPGDEDHADPNFKARLRECGRCAKPFETTPRWRYFCGRCRATKDVRMGLAQTFSATAR